MHLDRPLHQPEGVLGFAHQRPRSRFLFVLKIILLLFIVGALAVGVAAVIPQGSAGEPIVTVDITPDVVVTESALRTAGLLRFPWTFRIILALRGGNISEGAYTLSPHLSTWSLVRILTTTQPRPERTIKIIEGWSLRDIGHYLEFEGIAMAEELHELVGFPGVDYRFADPEMPRPKSFVDEFAFLQDKPDFIGLEGYLFPDTYRIYADASVEDIVRKMLANFDRKITPEIRDEITRSGRSLHQIITMASIVEAEISRPEDRPIAAGILWKRRDRGMLLQVDSTVNYVTGKSDARVLLDDAAVDSAYNTYRYTGLPRGPINNPGMDAILAALRPQSSPYWFFLTDKDGKTIFSKTLEEHNANVARYLR
ncbi:MAG: endolytic transglycosylase MltG [Candidatus Uhrbacteria bacterium]